MLMFNGKMDFSRNKYLDQFIDKNNIDFDGAGCYFKKVHPTKWFDKTWGATGTKGIVIIIDYRRNPFLNFTFQISGNIKVIRNHVNVHKKRIYFQVIDNQHTVQHYKVIFSGSYIKLVKI